MTDNLPAVVPTRDVAVQDTDSWIGVAGDVIKLANLIAPTEFVPKGLRNSAPATAAAILYGREVGLPPMTALTMTHVIEGRPAMSAEAMRGLIIAAGHQIQYDESTGARCVVRGRRFGEDHWTVVEWTLDMARQAGLLGKSNWKSYPSDMLVARATARLARMTFPDVIHGFRALEEFDDGSDEAPAEPAAPASRTRVARKAVARSAPPAQLPPVDDAARPERTAGPPLPGEDGYEPAQRTDQAPAPSDDATTPTQDEDSGNDLEGEAGATTTQTTGTDAIPVASVSVSDEPPGHGEGEAPDPGGSEDQAPTRAPRASSRAQHRMMFGQLTELGIADEERHLVVSRILGSDVESFNDLDTDQAKVVIDTLGRVRSRDELGTLFGAQRDPEATA